MSRVVQVTSSHLKWFSFKHGPRKLPLMFHNEVNPHLFFPFRKGTFWSNCVNILPQEKIHRNVTKSWTGKVVCCLDDANENNCSNVNGTMVQHTAWLPWSNSLCPFLSYFVLLMRAQTSSHSPKTFKISLTGNYNFLPSAVISWWPLVSWN